MSQAGVPLAALPNIGLASLAGRRIVYPHSTPDYFAEFAVQAVELGARIVGGCCGTTPAQIEAIREAFEAGRTPSASLLVDEPSLPVRPSVDEGETGLARAFREQSWVVCVELDPPKGGSLEGLVEATRELHASGKVDVVDVNDNPMARARMNALMTSAALQREVGIETIPHLTPRDTTVMGLEGLLLGAHATGARVQRHRARPDRARPREADRMRRSNSTSNARAFLGRRSRCGAGGHSTRGRGPEGTVPRAASGGRGARLRRAGAAAGQGRAWDSSS